MKVCSNDKRIRFTQGQAPISGGYIELRHSKHTDPAVRREQLIRAGASLSVSPAGSGAASPASGCSTVRVTSLRFDFCSNETTALNVYGIGFHFSHF